MKAVVAYEAPRRQKPAVKSLKWHRDHKGLLLRQGPEALFAKGVKGVYGIVRQKPNRRLGVFKWRLILSDAPVTVDGKEMSLDDLSELKAFASSFDAIPSGTVIAVSEETPAAPCAACGGHASENGRPDPAGEYAQMQRMAAAYARREGLGEYVPNSALPTGRVENGDGIWSFYTTPPGGGRPTIHEVKNSVLRQSYSRNSANESPTREEWEVIVTNPPAAHRGAILAQGLGETQEVGNKIILRGFHDDEQAARTAGSIARTYKVPVTFGPRNKLYEAAEANEARRRVHAPPRERTEATKRYEVIVDGIGRVFLERADSPEAEQRAEAAYIEAAQQYPNARVSFWYWGDLVKETRSIAREAPRAAPLFDEHSATELELYADNTSELYNQKLAVIANLKKRLDRGTYQPELAAKLWLYWVDAAAKRYAKEFGGIWHDVFPIEVRREVARRVEKRERYEMESLELPARPAYVGAEEGRYGRRGGRYDERAERRAQDEEEWARRKSAYLAKTDPLKVGMTKVDGGMELIRLGLDVPTRGDIVASLSDPRKGNEPVAHFRHYPGLGYGEDGGIGTIYFVDPTLIKGGAAREMNGTGANPLA